MGKHARRSDTRAALQILNTCLPFLLLSYLAMQSFAVNGLETAVCTVLAALFIVRIFMMMHDCGQPPQPVPHAAPQRDLPFRHRRPVRHAAICLVAVPQLSPCHQRQLEQVHRSIGNDLGGRLRQALALASARFGAAAFFTVYLASLTLGGAVGIIIFTIQHNFEGFYASDDAHWDYYRAALEGTSYLTLPGIANWFSADIAYNHVHHLSARIPNYRLAACHREHAQLFGAVKRIRLRDVAQCFKFILWDSEHRRITSVAQFRQMQAAAPTHAA